MPPELATYITEYGYIAIFGLVFLQELGVPNPVPNEIVLLFAGYLASINTLNFIAVFLTAVAADFFGTSILYFIFYFFGDFIFKHKPRWLPISEINMKKASDRLSDRGMWGIYVGRLLPYVRGYTSVAAGILRIKPRFFLTAVFVSAVTWSGGYVMAGKWLGKYWSKFAQQMQGVQPFVFLAAILIGCIIGIQYLKKRKKG